MKRRMKSASTWMGTGKNIQVDEGGVYRIFGGYPQVFSIEPEFISQKQ